MGIGHAGVRPKTNAILLIALGAFLVSASIYYYSLVVRAIDVAVGVASAVSMGMTPPTSLTSWEKARVVGLFAIPVLAGVYLFCRGVQKLRQQNRVECNRSITKTLN